MSTYPAPVIPLTVAPPAAAGVISSSQVKNNSTPAAAQTNGSSQSFAQDHWNRYAHLKGVDDSKNALIEDILSRYDAVVRQCQNLIDEQNAQNGRSNGSNHDSALQERQAAYIDHLQSLMDANPFVVVVVDGNNFLFNDALVRDGEKGGRSAAVVLKDELSEWVSKSVEHAPSDPKILIKVYADFKSVAGTFARGGVIENMSTFGEFARGFNTLFDFVDIGVGDVNSKIIDHLKLFLHDYHCHQVIFGGASQLLETNVPQEDMLRKRVALLQSVSTNVEIPFKTVFFTEVFRTSKSITSTATITPRTGTPGSLMENGSGNRPLPQSRNDSRASSISTANNPVAIANVPVAKSWAKRAQEVAPLPQTSEVPRAVEMPIRRHNKKGQRIDPPFNFDWDELKRVKKIKMCNMNYLHPNGCKWSAECCNHLHDYPATEAEIEILKSVSRETACHNGVTCDDLICVYGHRCPYPPSTEGSMRGLGCYLGEKCRFPREMHGIKDSTLARTTKLGKF